MLQQDVQSPITEAAGYCGDLAPPLADDTVIRSSAAVAYRAAVHPDRLAYRPLAHPVDLAEVSGSLSSGGGRHHFLAATSRSIALNCVANGKVLRDGKFKRIWIQPAFREAFERRRCLVLVDNVYEWQKTASGKQPYAIALAGGGIMALPGLWENWHSPVGEWIRSFAIITTTPNELCAKLHNRTPVVLKPEAWPAWLGEESADVSHLKSLLAPYPSDEMTAWRVSPRVASVKNNDANLIEALAQTAH